MQEQDKNFLQQQKSQLFPQIEHSISSLIDNQSFEQHEKFDFINLYKLIEKNHHNVFEQFGSQMNRNNMQRFSENHKQIHGINRFNVGQEGFILLTQKEKGLDLLHQKTLGQMMQNKIFDQNQVNQMEKRQVHISNILQKNFKQAQENLKQLQPNFCKRLSNFVYLQRINQNQFLSKVTMRYEESLKQILNINNDMSLINFLLKFWLNNFYEIIKQILRCTDLFTFTTLKKQQNQYPLLNRKLSEKIIQQQNQKNIQVIFKQQVKAKDSKKQKRKMWSKGEVKQLQRLLQNNNSLQYDTINELSKKLGRSVNAIQSKIQKLQKQKKQIKSNDLTLQKKMHLILKSCPEGLAKQQIIIKMEENFEMGDQNIWKKSVAQMLSSSKNIKKIKGTFGLKNLNDVNLQILNNQKNNFKIKVILCLLQFNQKKADLNCILKKYMQKFGRQEDILFQDTKRLQMIQANIHKTLSRYDIFDKRFSKTIYQFVEFQNEINQSQTKQYIEDNQIEQFKDSIRKRSS